MTRNRIIGHQQNLFGGTETPLWARTGFTQPAARRKDPATSHNAARLARKLAGLHREAIVACLSAHGPLGKDGIACRTKLTGVAVARRTVELQRDGRIEPTGKLVMSTAGRPEREWRIKQDNGASTQ
jgi:hypothetical protein